MTDVIMRAAYLVGRGSQMAASFRNAAGLSRRIVNRVAGAPSRDRPSVSLLPKCLGYVAADPDDWPSGKFWSRQQRLGERFRPDTPAIANVVYPADSQRTFGSLAPPIMFCQMMPGAARVTAAISAGRGAASRNNPGVHGFWTQGNGDSRPSARRDR